MSETIDVATPDGTADSFLATPRAGEPRGGVLLLIDAFGLRPRIEELARRRYTMSDTPAHDEAASERHFAELPALLDRTIGARRA